MKAYLALLLSVGAFAARTPTLDWRIVGGQTAEEGQFPYQVTVRWWGNHICGGSIINPTTILNAAHCAVGISLALMEVIAGTNQIDGEGVMYDVKSVTIHKDFDSSLIINDISLVHLYSSIVYTDRIKPIGLGTSNVGSGVELVLSGWGKTSYPGSVAKNLQFIKLLSISNKDCAEKHATSKPPITDGQICTLTRKGEGSCQGDSGGPLVSGEEQVGIVSWGRPCAVGLPDVFTRVSFYREWISQNQ